MGTADILRYIQRNGYYSVNKSTTENERILLDLAESEGLVRRDGNLYRMGINGTKWLIDNDYLSDFIKSIEIPTPKVKPKKKRNISNAIMTAIYLLAALATVITLAYFLFDRYKD